jgi:hypothetical protein
MKIGFIPPELFSICTQTVTESHQKKGFDNLSTLIAGRHGLSSVPGQIKLPLLFS